MQTINELGQYTFQAMLNNTVCKFGERPSIGFSTDKPYTYNQVNEKIAEARKLLKSVGVTNGSKVAIYSKNMPNWVIAYFGIVTLGAIAVPLLPDFNETEVTTCLNHAEIEVLFVSKSLSNKVSNMINTVIILDDFSILKGNPSDLQNAPIFNSKEDDVAAIIYTSGTTGRSKGVVLTHKNLIFTAIGGQYCYRVNKYDKFLSVLPLSHVYEFTVGLLMPFLNGALVLYLDGPPVARILMPTLQRIKPNIMLVVPLVIEKIYKSKVVPAFNKNNLTKVLVKTWLGKKIMSRLAGKQIKKAMGGKIKFFGIGGSKVDPEIEQFMKDAHFPYAIGYGLTETSPLIAFANPKKTKPGFIGFKIPGIQIKLINKDAVGVGELVVKGDNVMKAYYKAPDLTKATFTDDGWFKTGDLFKMEKNGRLMLCGRSKNLILGASGENIYPEDIEFVLNQHPNVLESLVIEGENSSLVAIVKLNDEKLKKTESDEKKKNSTENTIQAIQGSIGSIVSNISDSIAYKQEEILNEIKFFVNSKVSKNSKINKIEVIDEFEKTASQKIKRYLYSLINPKSSNNSQSDKT